MSSVVLNVATAVPIELRSGNDVFQVRAGQGSTTAFPSLAPDGSAAAPPYSFAADTDTGMFRNAAGRLALAHGGLELADIGQQIVSNTEVVPLSVGLRWNAVAPDVSYATEVTYFYYRPPKTDAVNEFNYFLYAEIETGQTLVGGGVTKTIHKGRGDAHYVALMHDGDALGGACFGYEGAMFKDGETAFIATFQGNSGFPESVVDQADCRGFHVLVHDPGTDPFQAGPAWFTTDGLFSAHGALANAFVAKCSEYVDGIVSLFNFPQFKVQNSAGRSAWEAYTLGQVFSHGAEATAGTPTTNAPLWSLRGYWWNGAAEEARVANWQQVTSVAGKSSLQIQLGTIGSEVIAGIWNEDVGGGITALDMQGNQVIGLDGIAPAASSSFNLAAHHRVVTVEEPTGTTGTVDWYDGNNQELRTGSATGGLTITLSNPTQGGLYELKVLQGATPRTVAFAGATILWEGGTAYTATASANAVDRVWLYFDGTDYQGWFKKGFA